jgi:hypothetical protein
VRHSRLHYWLPTPLKCPTFYRTWFHASARLYKLANVSIRTNRSDWMTYPAWISQKQTPIAPVLSARTLRGAVQLRWVPYEEVQEGQIMPFKAAELSRGAQEYWTSAMRTSENSYSRHLGE